MRVIAFSDPHGQLPEPSSLSKSDVVCICGDIIPLSVQRNYEKSLHWWTHDFLSWCEMVDTAHIVFIGGNHDFACEHRDFVGDFETALSEHGELKKKVHYLQNSSVVIDGVKFYGCPYSDIPGWAFHANDEEDYLPEAGTDVMLVHQAPKYLGMGVEIHGFSYREFGSINLMSAVMQRLPRYLFCGHIHDGSHHINKYLETTLANVSLLGADYKVHYEPLIIDIK